MPEALSEFFHARGGLGILIVLRNGPHRFTDLREALHISQSTLTKRLGEARDLGLITPEIDADETSVKGQYRITERGQFVARRMEQLDMAHAYQTMLDMHATVEDGKEALVDWVEEESVKKDLARADDQDPYVDPFGERVVDEP